jgi:DNA (cytosine-5)-methyltransferase 1
VLDVNGAEVEPVDIITFGSPCQDLSVAGKQAGLHKGERSNLFFEAIRIIKEMRESTDGRYPRIAVWENVPGAYSSNKGEDFRAVLEAFAQINDETADVPRPASGKWNPAGAIVGNGWSIAWRTFDAQYWGVPQRRKRIYLIADFGSERAGEVLFEQESVRGDSAQGGTAREGTADNAAGGVGGSGVRCLNVSDIAHTLDTSEGQAVCYSLDRASFNQGINAQYKPQIEEELASALVAKGPSAVCYPIDSHQQDSRFRVCADGIAPTLPGQMGTGGNNDPMVLESYQKVTGPLMANSHPGSYSGQDAYSDMLVTQKAKPPRKYIIRRLTPLECVRLQGLPDGWLDGVDGSDSAKYKMLGNGIAMPNAIYVVGCAVQLLQEGKHENEG